MSLIKFNLRNKTKINDIKVEEINIVKPTKFLENNGLINLTQISFHKLKKLNLSENNISKIDCLENNKFPNLEKLILKKNNIDNIDILEKVNLNELTELDFSNNKIKDITVLKKS